VIEKIGGASRDRTDDLIVANDALSQLSYSPHAAANFLFLILAAITRFRLDTRDLQDLDRFVCRVAEPSKHERLVAAKPRDHSEKSKAII
jgi:hypothetical protein